MKKIFLKIDSVSLIIAVHKTQVHTSPLMDL